MGTRAALAAMAVYAADYKASLPIIQLARQIVRDVPGKDYWSEAKAVQQWVKNNIRYTRDVRDVETISTPLETLKARQGDCDDMTVLVAALLEAIGHETRFVAVGNKPGQYVHVLPQTNIRGQWVSIECTEPVSLGWHPDDYPYQLIQYLPGDTRTVQGMGNVFSKINKARKKIENKVRGVDKKFNPAGHKLQDKGEKVVLHSPATPVFTTIGGAVAGFFTGGPVGAARGAYSGYQIGTSLRKADVAKAQIDKLKKEMATMESSVDSAGRPLDAATMAQYDQDLARIKALKAQGDPMANLGKTFAGAGGLAWLFVLL